MSNFSEERLSICNSCIYNEGGNCIICGCDLSLKTLDPNEFCPLSPGSKWGAFIESTSADPPVIIQETQMAPVVPPPRPPCQSCTKRR